MVQDWKDAAHLIMVVVQSCMRNNLMHHAGACYSQSDLTKHLLLLPPKYTTPRESALLMLLHRCVSSRQCLHKLSPLDNHLCGLSLLHCQHAQALETILGSYLRGEHVLHVDASFAPVFLGVQELHTSSSSTSPGLPDTGYCHARRPAAVVKNSCGHCPARSVAAPIVFS
jgi:hypothetical protein